MRLDGLTLMVAGSFVSGVGTLLLFGAWAQIRRTPVILWWAIAYLVNAIAIATLASGFALGSPVVIAVGSSLVPISASAVWVGARSFRDTRVPWPVLAAVPFVWLAAGAILPVPGGPQASGTVANFALTAGFFAAAAWELWRGRAEKLALRWPLAGILLLHAAIFGGGIIDVVMGNVPTDGPPPLSSWFSMIHFEQMIFLLGSAVFVVMMCRERMEAGFLAAARIDSLTGAANRGAFFAQADRLFRRATENDSPLSLIAFDLDHFKAINDTHGHAVGDHVLKSFAACAAAVLRPGDLFGRIGGEEFAALLPGASPEAAYVIADRVRHAFGATPGRFGDHAIRATLSAGVATGLAGETLEALLESADRALYRAKDRGRNRVERAEVARAEPASNVIRVA